MCGLPRTAEDLRDPLAAQSGRSADVFERLAGGASERDRYPQLLARFGGVRGRPLHAT